MRRRVSWMRVDLAAPVVLVATIVAFAGGSSSVAAVRSGAQPLRWVLLLVLAAAALALAASRRSETRPPRLPYATAGALATLALVSAAWSVAPGLTLARGATFVAVLGAAAGLSVAAAGDVSLSRRLLVAVAAAATTVALLGALLWLLDPDAAMQQATTQTPARYRGLGENPNTMPMLYALGLPAAVWLAATARRRTRVAAVCASLAVAASLFASGSRGAAVSAFAGLLVLSLLTLRGRRLIAATAAATAVFAVGVGASTIGEPVAPGSPEALAAAAAAPSPAAPQLANDPNEIGRRGVPSSRRTPFGSSGRVEAWTGALEDALRRPLLGFGFGTEDRVFVDRYYVFQGARPENSYIGLMLQLGAIGLALFGAFGAVVAPLAVRNRRCPSVPAWSAIAAAGLVIAVVQSYVYAVGNVATTTFWLAAFIAGASRA